MSSLPLPLLSPHYCRPCLLRLYLRTQTRTLTTSPSHRKHGALPTFKPTPSPVLDDILSTFRSNIFLPSHLIKLQRDLLYKKKNHALLTSDEPATVRLGTEVIQLKPLTRVKDEPATRPAIKKVVDLMTKTKDWRNLPGFLEGLMTARRSVKGFQLEKMVRKMNECGKQGMVMECLKRVEDTGMGLWELRVAREVMWGATTGAMQAGWSEVGVEKCVKYAEYIWEMMLDPKHREKMHGDQDAKKRPEIIGVLVQMHAARGLVENIGDDVGSVEKYVKMMLQVWGNTETTFEDGDWDDANFKLTMWAPVWHGMTMAQKVLGAKTPIGKELGSKLKELESLIERAQPLVRDNSTEEGPRRGLKLYESLSQVSL